MIPEFTLNPLLEPDYPRLVELFNLLHADSPGSVAEFQNFFGTRKDDIYCLEYLSEGASFSAALLAIKAEDGQDRVRIDLFLHPDKVSVVLRESLYTYLLSKLKEPKSLVTRVREDWSGLHRFFESKGFEELERAWESKLDLTSFKMEPFITAFDKAKAADISFKTLADLPDTETTHRMVYQSITQDLLPSVPMAEPLNIWPYKVWLERYLNKPGRNPKTVFLAFKEDELVGMSELYDSHEAGKLKTGLTAVKKAYRRKGIAMSLKLIGIQYALEHQIKEIATTNHSVNRPMLSINEALGFVKDPAWIRLKKELSI